MGEIATLVRADLRAADSRLKSQITSMDWHERAAKVLSWLWTQNWQTRKTELLALNLIPLSDGSWARGVDGDIFYPDTSGITVPADLGLRIVDPDATQGPERKKLFGYLGVKFADI